MKLRKLGKLFTAATLTVGLAAGSSAFTEKAQAATEEPTHAFYIVPHPDDELLSMGTSIINHNFNGNHIVHMVLLTGGEKSSVYNIASGQVNCWMHGHKHDPEAEGYAPFDREVFKKGKIENFKHSAYILGVKPENIHIYDLGNEEVTVEEVEKIIRDLKAKYPKSKYKSISYHDDHPDHVASGQALLNLYNEGVIDDARFYAKNSLVLSGEWKKMTDAPARPEKYDEAWYPYIKASAQTYTDWNPKKGYYHSGYMSVRQSFDWLLEDPTVYYHKPNE